MYKKILMYKYRFGLFKKGLFVNQSIVFKLVY